MRNEQWTISYNKKIDFCISHWFWQRKYRLNSDCEMIGEQFLIITKITSTFHWFWQHKYLLNSKCEMVSENDFYLALILAMQVLLELKKWNEKWTVIKMTCTFYLFWQQKYRLNSGCEMKWTKIIRTLHWVLQCRYRLNSKGKMISEWFLIITDFYVSLILAT